jgi:purine-binding chemotaxis protein CheW
MAEIGGGRQSGGGDAVETLQLACFLIDELLCGVDISRVQEINRRLVATQVPLAADYVIGIMNLRGRIVTVINLGKKLGLAPCRMGAKSRVVIINQNEEYVGLLVDRIRDVVTVKATDIAPPPANIGGTSGRFFAGACRVQNELISVLDVESVLADE